MRVQCDPILDSSNLGLRLLFFEMSDVLCNIATFNLFTGV